MLAEQAVAAQAGAHVAQLLHGGSRGRLPKEKSSTAVKEKGRACCTCENSKRIGRPQRETPCSARTAATAESTAKKSMKPMNLSLGVCEMDKPARGGATLEEAHILRPFCFVPR